MTPTTMTGGWLRRWPGAISAAALAVVIVRLFLSIIAAYWGIDPFDGRVWTRWDSNLYLSIATDGYTLRPTNPGDDSGYAPGTWMGNAGWMPAYPWLLRSLNWIGVPILVSGIVLAELFCLATLAVMWAGPLSNMATRARFVCLLLAAFFPGFVYLHAAFPLSMVCFFLTLAMEALRRDRWTLAGAMGFIAALSYASGFLIALVAILWLMLGRADLRWLLRARAAVLVGGLSMAGLGVVCLIHQLTLGRWDAFFLVQQKYGHGLHNPLDTLTQFAGMLQGSDRYMMTGGAQILLIAGGVLACIAWCSARWSQRTPSDQLFAIYASVFWLFPLVMGPHASPWRAAAMLMPAAPLFRGLALRWQLGLLIVFLLLGEAMTVRFYLGAAI